MPRGRERCQEELFIIKILENVNRHHAGRDRDREPRRQEDVSGDHRVINIVEKRPGAEDSPGTKDRPGAEDRPGPREGDKMRG